MHAFCQKPDIEDRNQNIMSGKACYNGCCMSIWQLKDLDESFFFFSKICNPWWFQDHRERKVTVDEVPSGIYLYPEEEPEVDNIFTPVSGRSSAALFEEAQKEVLKLMRIEVCFSLCQSSSPLSVQWGPSLMSRQKIDSFICCFFCMNECIVKNHNLTPD